MLGLLIAMTALSGWAADVVEERSGYDLWGMRPRHVAVVNPVLGEDPQWTLSLGGDWEFCAHTYNPERCATWGERFAQEGVWKNPRQLRVPGFVETQGVGEPGMARPWDCTWDCSPKPLAHVFTGAGWYRRTFTIPSAWRGRRIWLKVGDVSSQGWFWVNDVQVAWVESYCGTYKYDITDLVKPGEKAKFVIQISNAVAKRCGSRNCDNVWLGISREIELEATPAVYVDDAWCRGDFDRREAQVKVKVGGERKVKGEGEQWSDDLLLRATVEGETREVRLGSSPSSSDFTLKVPLRNFRAWSPEHPNLYTATVELVENGVVTQMRRERFGVRKLEVRGKDFYLNGKPFFIRGIGYHNVQPVYGPSRMADREYRRFEVKRMRDAGFNYLRTHTRCETPEFFEVCDELGMMVQPELPYYTDIPCEKFPFDPVRDAKELYVHMRRHPSFAVYSHGNEGSFGPALGRHMYALIKAMDPDRLVIEQDGFSCKDWARGKFSTPDRSDFEGGQVEEWERGTVTSDRPMVTHEYLNLSVKANAELEDKYVGIWQTPFTRKLRGEFLAKFGLTDFWGKRLQLAQHRLQAYWIKHGLESARQDPECDGYCYWSAQDCTTPVERDGVQTYTAQGMFDPFWGDKPGGHTAASVAVFNSPSGVFCDTVPESRIAVSGERIVNAISFAHYGEADLPSATLAWRLVTRDGRKTLLQGEQSVGAQPLGGIRKVAEVAFDAPEVAKAAALRFEVSLGGVRNAWDMWLFPQRPVRSARGVAIAPALAGRLAARYADLVPFDRVAEAKVVVAPADSPELAAALARGQHVVSVGKADGKPDVKLGWWWLGDQVGTAIADDPMLGELPHADSLDPLFFRIFKKGEKLPLAGVDEKDLAIVCEGGYACSFNLAVRRHGKAREYLVRGLDVCADLPEAKALLDGLLDRAQAGGGAFEGFEKPEDLPGAVSMIWTGKEVLADVSGYADLATKRPASTNDLFWIASNTKAIACALMLRQIDKGLVRLDAPVADYLPEWKDIRIKGGKAPKHAPTVREVMGHTAGLAFFPKMPITQFSVQELAHMAVTNGLDHDVGEYRYSNWGIDVAMAVVERVTGKPWEKALQAEVLDPLGMKDTTFFPTVKDYETRMAKSYRAGPDNQKKISAEMYVDQLVFPYDKPGTHAEAGGGLFATASDLLAFFRMVASRGKLPDGRQFISERLMEEWYGITDFYRGKKYTFGMDAIAVRNFVRHGGAYNTDGAANWKRGTARVFMTQTSGSSARSEERFRNWVNYAAQWLDSENADVVKLKAVFAAPPQAAKPQVWWHWMNGNVSKAAITSDLESLADAGIGGVQLFDIGCGVAEGPIRFNTPEWDDHVRFAAAECARLGLDLTLANCSGWTSSGGPWVKPADAMKYVTHTETRVKGGARPPALPVEGGEETLKHYYRDVAVLAFPVPKAEREARLMRGIRFSVAFDKSIWDQDVVIRVGNDVIVTKCMSEGWCDCGAAWGGEKFVALPHPVPADTKVSFELPVNCHHDPKDPPNIRIAKWRFDARAALPEMNVRSSFMRGVTPPAGDEPGAEAVIAKDAILDLTGKFDPKTGLLDWTAPASAPEWTVLRIGCACRIATCSPATPGGEGLEVDKLDASAVARHFDAYVGKFVKLPAVKGVLVDSYEVGSQNWTPGLEKAFQRRFGYSILPYLACFSLRIVDSASASEKAFADFRLLISEQFAENYAGTMTRKCEEAGVVFKVEPYGNSPADDTLYARRCHVPMMEFWAGAEPGLSSDMANHLRNAKAVASAAHFWGRPVVAAEAFTGHNKAARWIQHPYLIKGVGDWFYAHGANRMVWNHFTHQPYPNALPGIALGPYGTMFAAAPWWPFAKPWVRYESRCQAMLQAGRFAPDLLYYLGDEAPQSGYSEGASVRFDWDAIGHEGLAALKVSGGRLVAPSGVTYARLVLPPEGKRILPESAREIARLKAAGAEIVAAEMAERGLEPDFAALGAVAPVRAHHRLYADGVEGYFVASSATNATKAVWSFRQAQLVPSVWDPEAGKISTLAWRRVGGRCELELELRPCEALFVMFTREAVSPTAAASAASRTPVEIDKWTLRFPSGKGCLAETNLTRLVSWTTLPGETKFFSGIAEYETEMTLGEPLGPGATLDLGEVHELAEVTVNGKRYEPLWRPPYRLDLSDQRGTRLKLRVRVTNCWPNRLIGDAAKPLDRELNAAGDVVRVPDWVKEGKPSPTGRQTFTFHDHWRADEPLRPAGLMGPVVLR